MHKQLLNSELICIAKNKSIKLNNILCYMSYNKSFIKHTYKNNKLKCKL